MTLLLDVHISPFITHWIKQNFKVECISFRQLDWEIIEDEIAFLRAKRMNAVVLTKDEDFIGCLKSISLHPKSFG